MCCSVEISTESHSAVSALHRQLRIKNKNVFDKFVSEHVQHVQYTQFSSKSFPHPRSLDNEAMVAVVCSGI